MNLKPFLSQVNFALGRTPIIEKVADYRPFIPQGYDAVLLISADFELAWAWRLDKHGPDALKLARDKAQLERANVPKILELCDRYTIPITWATVGHLFLESCNRVNGMAHPDLPRLSDLENDHWRFAGQDWFDDDPCSDYLQAPEWYCPDLIRAILKTRVKHEIACHTFSHIDCRDGVCPPEVLREELRACQTLAGQMGLELKSFVHPAHTIGNLDLLAQEGFGNYRTDFKNVLGYPKRHENGLWELQQTLEFNYRPSWSIDYHIKRYKEIMNRAMKSHTVCVAWFHPSCDPVMVEQVFPVLFEYIDGSRQKIWVGTHGAYLSELNRNHE